MLSSQLFARDAPCAQILVCELVVGEDQLLGVVHTLLIVGQGRRLFLEELIDRVILQVTFAVPFTIGTIFVNQERAVFESHVRANV